MVYLRLNKFLPIAFLACISTLAAQSPGLLDVYQNHAYYLAIERPSFFSRPSIKGLNPQGEITVARPGRSFLTIQEDFFQDSPGAMAEIAGFKKATRNQMLIYAAGLGLLLASMAAEANIGLMLSLEGANVLTLSWSVIKRRKALDHLYRAMYRHNLFALKSRMPADTYDHFEANSMYRVILPFGGSQIVLNQRSHDLPRFLRPAPDTDQLFTGTGAAAHAYTLFQSKRRESTHFNAAGIGLFLGTALVISPPLLELTGPLFELTGRTGTIGLLFIGLVVGPTILGSIGISVATAADNHLNRAVYLYNQQLLHDGVSDSEP